MDTLRSVRVELFSLERAGRLFWGTPPLLSDNPYITSLIALLAGRDEGEVGLLGIPPSEGVGKGTRSVLSEQYCQALYDSWIGLHK
jgi:hypothetical protein